METKFYRCPICGNLVVKIKDSGVTPHCCGKEMILLKPGQVDASHEKHVPTIECKEKGAYLVKVGSTPHPMTGEHHICFICLETENGVAFRYLKNGDELSKEAMATFHTDSDQAKAAFEYCNLHGLWKLDVKEDPCKNVSGKGNDPCIDFCVF